MCVNDRNRINLNEVRHGSYGVNDVQDRSDLGQCWARYESASYGLGHHEFCQFILSSKSDHEKGGVSLRSPTQHVNIRIFTKIPNSKFIFMFQNK